MDNTYTQEVIKYAKEMDLTQLSEYIEKVYTWLERTMIPGKSISIDDLTETETKDLFIAVVKMHIDESECSEIEFTGNYEGIRRADLSGYRPTQFIQEEYLKIASKLIRI